MKKGNSLDILIMKEMEGKKKGMPKSKVEEVDMEEYEEIAEEIIEAIAGEDEELLAESLKNFIEMCMSYEGE